MLLSMLKDIGKTSKNIGRGDYTGPYSLTMRLFRAFQFKVGRSVLSIVGLLISESHRSDCSAH